MSRVINILLIIILFSSCTMLKNINTTDLNGQKWIIVRQIGPATGSGNTWIFLPDNCFIETSWYSGGAYFINHYSGTYVYDADNKVVFLKYNKDLLLKNALKKRLALNITTKDTSLTVTDGWKKPKENPSKNKQSLKIHDILFEDYTFKIDIIDK
jgi:hypothetical protein